MNINDLTWLVFLSGCLETFIAIYLILSSYVRRSASGIRNGGMTLILGIGSIAAYYLMQNPAPSDPWPSFAQAHHCAIVEKREGHSNQGLGVSTTGQVGAFVGNDTPNQTAYKCDDGVTYWRNDN
ncbi:MAG: hypothetical protein ABF537_09165 [Acetobacter sp.]